MRETVVGCDECDWPGEDSPHGKSSASAKRHHEQTGHTTWINTVTTTFYGDPVAAFAREHGMTILSKG